jgi:Flp pilus assembly protein TadG
MGILRVVISSRRRLGRQRDCADRGSVSLELVVVFPVLLLIIFGGMQGALYYYARSVALAAAQEGSRAAGAETATAGDGQRAASGFVTQAGGADVLRASQVSSSRSATSATVTVTGQSLSLLPGFGGFTVTQTASAPVERITR